MAENKKPLISIIVTSYAIKRFKDICDLLDSIREQSYPNLEVIFVVDRSRELYEDVKSYVEKRGLLNFKVIFNDESTGLSASRNLGIKYAKGDIISFVDDDVILFPDWAHEIVKTFEDCSIIGVTGQAFVLLENRSIEWLPSEFHWLIGGTTWYDRNALVDVRNAWGMNMAFRREAFTVCKSFKTNFGLRNIARSSWKDPPSEDVDFSFRVKRKTGKRIVYNPKVRVYHKGNNKLNLSFILQRSFSVGYQRRMIKKFYENKGDNVLTLEHELLGRIFRRLLPEILKDFLKNPKIAFRRLMVILLILSFITLGYYSTI